MQALGNHGAGRLGPRRRNTRLPGYDYGLPGGYFVTMCIVDRLCILSDVVGGKIVLTALGDAVSASWQTVEQHFPGVSVVENATMPNHVHVVVMLPDVGAGLPRPGPAGQSHPSLGQVVGYFKYLSTVQVNSRRGTPGMKVWQRGYYERVVRNEAELNRTRLYILNNPAQWADDPQNPLQGPSTAETSDYPWETSSDPGA